MSKHSLSLDTYRLINEVFLVGDDIDRHLFSNFALTVRQYHLLNWLDLKEQAGLTELADLLLCDKSNVTHIARRLLAAKLIEQVPDNDRRFTVVRMTPAGREAHAKAKAALIESIFARFASVSETEEHQFQALLNLMHTRLRSHLDFLSHS